MLSPPVGALGAAYASVPNTETNLSTTAGAAAGLKVSEGTGYTLDSIGFQITRYAKDIAVKNKHALTWTRYCICKFSTQDFLPAWS